MDDCVPLDYVVLNNVLYVAHIVSQYRIYNPKVWMELGHSLAGNDLFYRSKRMKNRLKEEEEEEAVSPENNKLWWTTAASRGSP